MILARKVKGRGIRSKSARYKYKCHKEMSAKPRAITSEPVTHSYKLAHPSFLIDLTSESWI